MCLATNITAGRLQIRKYFSKILHDGTLSRVTQSNDPQASFPHAHVVWLARFSDKEKRKHNDIATLRRNPTGILLHFASSRSKPTVRDNFISTRGAQAVRTVVSSFLKFLSIKSPVSLEPIEGNLLLELVLAAMPKVVTTSILEPAEYLRIVLTYVQISNIIKCICIWRVDLQYPIIDDVCRWSVTSCRYLPDRTSRVSQSSCRTTGARAHAPRGEP